MPQFDQAHDWTDEQIEQISRRISREYRQAVKDMRKKLEEWPKKFEEERNKLEEQLKNKEITKRQYRRKLHDLQVHEPWLRSMIDELSSGTMSTTERAMQIVNDDLPGVFAYGMNYSTYQIERQSSANTMYTLVDEDTVRLLVKDEHDLLPFVEIDKSKAVRWDRQKFQSAVTQGILQGESIPDISKRIQSVIKMSESASIRAARTACTGAENAGRTQAYKRANDLGIETLSEWRATLDNRTRQTHREMNGIRVKPGDKFPNGCIEPGDPSGPAEEVWNCRCALVPYVVGTDYGPNDGRWYLDEKIDGQTYDEWVGERRRGNDSEQTVPNDGNPESLAGVRRGAPMSFDEANELRGNPNYNMAQDAKRDLEKAQNDLNSLLNEQIRTKNFDEAALAEAKRIADDAERAYKEAAKEELHYHINCQTCVVANEARRRGYNVMASPCTKGTINSQLARQTNLAWIDRNTGDHPDYILYDGEGKTDYLGRKIPTYKRYVDWLESDGVIEEGARYTIEFQWSKGGMGHIVCLDRTEGGLRLYDPQCGESYSGKEVREYLKRVQYKAKSYGEDYSEAPQLLKVSDYDFDASICDQILLEAE